MPVIPFPSEIVIPPAAYIASKPESSLNIFLVVLFGTIGALIGALINYYLSLWLGRIVIYKFADSRLGHLFLLDSEKIKKSEAYFNEKGKFIGSKMNWGKLDVILSMTPQPHRLVFSMPIHSIAHVTESLGTDKGKPIALFSPEWERRLSIWLRNLTAGLAKRGITYKDFALALIDEPQDSRIEYMKKAGEPVLDIVVK